MSKDSWGSGATSVRRHVFPEHRTQPVAAPEWMRASRDAVLPARFGDSAEPVRQRTQQPQPQPKPQSNQRVDPLAEARAALDEERRKLEAAQQALDASRAELDEERAALADAAAEISVARKKAIDVRCDELAEIALAVVQTIITDAFDEAPERATALARAALADDESATLRVGPALHIALLESGEASSAVLDPSLPPFGCIAESPTRRVITGLEERLAEVLRALKEAT